MQIRKAIQFFSVHPLHDPSPANMPVQIEWNVYAYVKYYLRTSDLLNLRGTCREARSAITTKWLAQFRFTQHFACDMSFLYTLHFANNIPALFQAEQSSDKHSYQISSDQYNFRVAILDGNIDKALACLNSLPSAMQKYHFIRHALKGLPSCDAFYYDTSSVLRDEILAVITAVFTNNNGTLDFTAKDQDNYRIIHWLCLFADLVTLEKLFLQYPNRADEMANYRTSQGLTPLHMAIFSGNLAVVKALTKRSIDMNALTEMGLSPLFMAASLGLSHIVSFLIKQKINIYHIDPDSLTAADAAINAGCVDSTRHLLSTQAFDLDAPLFHAVSSGNLELVQCVLAYHPNVNARALSGLSPLLIAAVNGFYGITELLLQHGAKTYTTDNNGMTPLFCAAANGHLETCKVLLKYNALVTTTVKNWRLIFKNKLHHGHHPWWTAINAIEIAKLNGHDEIHQLLKDHYQEFYNKHIAFTGWLR